MRVAEHGAFGARVDAGVDGSLRDREELGRGDAPGHRHALRQGVAASRVTRASRSSADSLGLHHAVVNQRFCARSDCFAALDPFAVQQLRPLPGRREADDATSVATRFLRFRLRTGVTTSTSPSVDCSNPARYVRTKTRSRHAFHGTRVSKRILDGEWWTRRESNPEPKQMSTWIGATRPLTLRGSDADPRALSHLPRSSWLRHSFAARVGTFTVAW